MNQDLLITHRNEEFTFSDVLVISFSLGLTQANLGWAAVWIWAEFTLAPFALPFMILYLP